MNSLTVTNRLPQLRAIPVQGVPLFRYERRVSNRWVPCNHSRAAGVVGVFHRRAKQLCASLTDGSGTEEASLSMSSAGNQKRSESSICALAMSMSALAHSSSSNATLRK